MDDNNQNYYKLCEGTDECKCEGEGRICTEFVLEIIKGDMLFKELTDTTESMRTVVGDVGVSAQLSFSNDYISTVGSGDTSDNTLTNEQVVKITYTYNSPRQRVVQLDNKTFVDNLNKFNAININSPSETYKGEIDDMRSTM